MRRALAAALALAACGVKAPPRYERSAKPSDPATSSTTDAAIPATAPGPDRCERMPPPDLAPTPPAAPPDTPPATPAPPSP